MLASEPELTDNNKAKMQMNNETKAKTKSQREVNRRMDRPDLTALLVTDWERKRYKRKINEMKKRFRKTEGNNRLRAF